MQTQLTAGSFPLSKSEMNEMRAILDRMKERWKQNRYNSWYADLSEKKPAPKPPAKKKEFVKENEQYNVEPQYQRGCRLCGMPTLLRYCSNKCEVLDKVEINRD